MAVKEPAAPQELPPLSRSQLDALIVRDDMSGLVHIVLHITLIAVSAIGLSAAWNPIAEVVFTLMLGASLVFLFAPLHETIHKTAFRSPWLNRWVGRICGFLIFLPPRYFQSFHMAHHRFTQMPGKDPELDAPKPDSLFSYLVFLSGVLYWKEQAQMFWQYSLGSKGAHFIQASRLKDIAAEVRVFAALYILLLIGSAATGNTVLVKYWIFPLLVGQPFLRLFLVAEHTLCPEVKDMMANTRTTLTNGPMRWLCWNMSYHVEHHAYPAIPFHRLQDTHRIISPRIRFLGKGYFSVNREIVGDLLTRRGA